MKFTPVDAPTPLENETPQNYIVRPVAEMDPIPDHCIQSPFGRNSKTAIVSDDRFNKYRAHIIPWYRVLYDKYMYCTHGFTCDVCGSVLGNTKSGLILAHLASLKHLRAAGVLEDEKDKRSRVCVKEPTDTRKC
jgi:hypothetical protein